MPSLVRDDVLNETCWDIHDPEPTPRSPKKIPRWYILIQGNRVKVYRAGCANPFSKHDFRDCIGPWSGQSRMRLLDYLNTIDYANVGPGVFLTLTYPDHVLRKKYRQRSIDRAVFLRYLERAVGKQVPCIWRIEWEQRKSGQYTGKIAPHFHLMLFGISGVTKTWGREWWRATINSGEGPLVSDAREIFNEDGACRYLSKYVSKYRSLDIATYHNSGIQFGRHWGICRKNLIPRKPVELCRQLDQDEELFVKQWVVARRNLPHEGHAHGFTLYGEAHKNKFQGWIASD